jgi:general secretion pathway protein G
MGTRGARELVLKQDLQTMRMAIDDYSLDKRHPPESLQTLVDEKYLRAIPINPFTHKADWVAHNVTVDLGSPKSAIGIDDVHASGGQTDSSGTPYSEW